MQMVMARRRVDGTAGTGRAIASLCFIALTIAGLLPLGSAAISAYTLLAAFWMLFGLATLPLALPAHSTRLFGTALLIAGVTVTACPVVDVESPVACATWRSATRASCS